MCLGARPIQIQDPDIGPFLPAPVRGLVPGERIRKCESWVCDTHGLIAIYFAKPRPWILLVRGKYRYSSNSLRKLWPARFCGETQSYCAAVNTATRTDIKHGIRWLNQKQEKRHGLLPQEQYRILACRRIATMVEYSSVAATCSTTAEHLYARHSQVRGLEIESLK